MGRRRGRELFDDLLNFMVFGVTFKYILRQNQLRSFC